uniref:Uncharacterized protein n=1 Tax=Kwoniella bestiolae CBS 10118 TaxID=1296100 RepID=A0A1B9FS04_9TREE|nr:hypothetical protein I302_09236 [Kwoniella bestiolae CBS 10118]OCF21557.1 hypothetical protein I302_09236 [Kwoniella bestiolae CBS 10118]
MSIKHFHLRDHHETDVCEGDDDGNNKGKRCQWLTNVDDSQYCYYCDRDKPDDYEDP